uniref:Uncharacterized protein n=1 Tax=Arundo donax TaxID=35708 RepID=A0A0A9BIX3_ARUDO
MKQPNSSIPAYPAFLHMAAWSYARFFNI